MRSLTVALVFALAVAADASTEHPTHDPNPAAGNAIQYVSPNGNDANDGLSWSTAKLTVYAALIALPGGTNSIPETAGSGVVKIASYVKYGGPAIGGGVWLMGSSDPNYARPPTGWLRQNGGVTIECGTPNVFGAHGHLSICLMTAGNNEVHHPGIWLSGVVGVTLNNVGIGGFVSQAVKIGIASNGDRTLGGGSSSVSLNGFANNPGDCLIGGGPAIDIGSTSFWIYIEDASVGGCVGEDFVIAPTGLSRSHNVVTVTTTGNNDVSPRTNDGRHIINIQNADDPSFNGTHTVTSVSGNPQNRFTFSQIGPNATSGHGFVFTDGSFGIAINPGTTGQQSDGLIFIDRPSFSSGGVVIHAGPTGSATYIRQMSIEGNFHGPGSGTPPAVLVAGAGAQTSVLVDTLETADFSNVVPDVEVDAATSPDRVLVMKLVNTQGGPSVKGPATVLGDISNSSRTISPTREGETGFFGTRVFGSTDAARRLFSPSAVRYPNLATVNAFAWTYLVSTGTITSGLAAPDGTSNAASATSNSGQANIKFYGSTSVSYGVSDYWVYGVWEKALPGQTRSAETFSLNGNGFSRGGLCAPVGGPGTQAGSGGALIILPPYAGDGEWEFYAGVCKVITAPTRGDFFVNFVGVVNAGVTTGYYAPILLHIPAADRLSDNEVYEIAMNLSTYGPECRVGTICGLPGQILHEDAFNVRLNTPVSSSDKCMAGTMWADSHFVYVCTATNTIKRSVLSSF